MSTDGASTTDLPIETERAADQRRTGRAPERALARGSPFGCLILVVIVLLSAGAGAGFSVHPGGTLVAPLSVRMALPGPPSHLSVSPGAGAFGTLITANGTGMGPNTTVAFGLDGEIAASRCSADSTGAFPGATGTPCTFWVPAAPSGPQELDAFGVNVSTVPVQSPPSIGLGIALDSAKAELFVPDENTNNVSVISEENNTVVATIPVGSYPDATLYDPARGEIFVSNMVSNNVSIINDTTDSVVASVNVSFWPGALSYDPVHQTVYVADQLSRRVSVINATTDALVTTVVVGSWPLYLALDPLTDQTFVTNSVGSTVSVIDDGNNTNVATIPVGYNPWGLVYDPGRGEIFVAVNGQNNVSVISGATDAIVANISVGYYPEYLDYDPAVGDILAVNDGSSNVSVISDATNTVVATIAVGDEPDAIALDPQTGLSFVANEQSANVSVIDDATNSVITNLPAGSGPVWLLFDGPAATMDAFDFYGASVTAFTGVSYANVPFTVDARITGLTETAGPIGSIIGVRGTGVLPNATIALTFNGTTLRSNCSSDLLGSFPGASGTPCSFVVPGVPDGIYPIGASDGTNSASASFQVEATLALSPGTGAAGASVAASGIGFAPRAPITLTFGGTTVSSTCTTDAAGQFPGTSGTPCSFAVPSVAFGSFPVVAADGTTSATASFAVVDWSVAPRIGSVGSPVSASGAGFLANGNVSVSVGGVPVASNCSSDGGGSVPGSGSVPCTFLVPSLPFGPTNVTGLGWSEAGTIGVGRPLPFGGAPGAAAYDPAQGEIFVVDGGSPNVTVLNGSNDQRVANITVGNDPQGIAFDPGLDEVFVADAGSDNVSVIDAATNLVVAAIPVGLFPYGIAYDAATNEIFVANEYGCDGSGCNGTVSVIADAWNAVVATVIVQSDPMAVVYDPDTGTVYVANNGTTTVSVISDESLRVVATVQVLPDPDALAFDNATGQVYVAEYGAASLSVISDLSNIVVASVTTGSAPDAVAYDAALGAVFVGNRGSGTLTAITASSDVTVASVPLPGDPWALLFDPAASSLFVVGANVTVLDLMGYLPAAPLTVRSSLTPELDPSSGVVGSIVHVSGDGFANDSVITLSFNGTGVPSSCSTDATGAFPGASGSTCTFAVPSTPNGYYTVSATDGTNVGNATFFVGALVLSTWSGPVGTNVSAAGIVPTTGGSVQFSIDGEDAPSSCSANDTGNFPNVTGATCAFDIPIVPGGDENVTAFGWTSTSVVTGAGTSAAALDPANGDVYAVNSGSDTVTVLAQRTNAVVATIDVGLYPQAIIYDGSDGLLFVANGAADTVEAINGTTNTVVHTTPVGGGPTALALDPTSGAIFVANSNTGNVSVLSGASLSVVATIGAGAEPWAMTYDPANGEVYVANENGDNVTVFNAATYAVDASVVVGSDPDALQYDPGTGTVYVANSYSFNVSVISDTNNTVLGSVRVGDRSDGLAYDPRLGEVFVANAVPDTVSVINDSSLTLVATIHVGTGPGPLLYDPSSGLLYVLNYYSNNVSVISELSNSVVAVLPVGVAPDGALLENATGAILIEDRASENLTVLAPTPYATVPFDVTSTLALPPGTPSVDIGELVTVSGTGYGDLSGIQAFELGPESGITCLSAAVGTCGPSGVLTTAANGTFSVTFRVPSVPNAGTYLLTLTDAAGNSANLSVIVNLGPSVVSLNASVSVLDLGASTTLRVVAAGGSGTYGYTWAGLPAGCSGGSSATLICQPGRAGNYSVSVTVTDSDGVWALSPSVGITVHPDPEVSLPVGTPLSGAVDAGQRVTFTALARNGSGSYTSFAWQGLPALCTGVDTAIVTCSGSALLARTYSISATVTDSTGTTSSASPSLVFVVNPDPFVGLPHPDHPSADVGQTVAWSDANIAGEGIHNYTWLGLPTGCSQANSATLSCAVTGAGVFNVSLEVTDGNNFTVQSAGVGFTVYADPTVVLTVAPAAVDLGQTMAFTATVSNGSGHSTFAWTGLPAGCSASGTNASCRASAPGPLSVGVTVTDSNGVSVRSANVTVAVANALSATISASAVTASVGQSIAFTASASGGTGATTYAWQFGDGSTGTGSTASHAYATPGNYSVTLWVNDTVGGTFEKTVTITVLALSSGSTGSGVTLADEAAIGIAAVVVLLALLLVRRRRSENPAAGAPDPASVPAVPSGAPRDEAWDPESEEP
jgi:YVTN family beta-propeller protein